MKVKILFFTANPDKDLTTDEEYKDVESAINSTKYREYIDLILKPSTTLTDMINAINTHEPDIVHFTGHGSKEGEIRLMDESGMYDELLSAQDLADLFETTEDNLKLVFLNACHSKTQAQAVVKSIDNTIGMNTTISNQASRTLAKQFYTSFGNGKSIEKAFKQAKLQLSKDRNIPEHFMKSKQAGVMVITDMVEIDESASSSNITQTYTVRKINAENYLDTINNSGTMNFD